MKKLRILLILFSIIILIFVSLQVIYIPLISINSSNISKNTILGLIKNRSFWNFTLISIINKIDYQKSIQLYGDHIIKKNNLFTCSINIIQNIEYYSINLNGYNMIINKNGLLIENVDEINKANSRFLFNINIKSNKDTKDLYLYRISPFLKYILVNNSKLCFMINQINFDDSYGLHFVEFDNKKVIFGKRDDFENLESELINLRNNLKEKQIYDKYNEFDFRFYKRIVLRYV